MDLTKMIYIASPFSHPDLDVELERFNKITEVAASLTKKYGYAFILPITQSYQLQRILPSLGGTFANWESIDLTFISHSDEVWVIKMEGWDRSVGVMAEIKFATGLDIPVKYLNPNSLRFVKG